MDNQIRINDAAVYIGGSQYQFSNAKALRERVELMIKSKEENVTYLGRIKSIFTTFHLFLGEREKIIYAVVESGYFLASLECEGNTWKYKHNTSKEFAPETVFFDFSELNIFPVFSGEVNSGRFIYSTLYASDQSFRLKTNDGHIFPNIHNNLTTCYGAEGVHTQLFNQYFSANEARMEDIDPSIIINTKSANNKDSIAFRAQLTMRAFLDAYARNAFNADLGDGLSNSLITDLVDKGDYYEISEQTKVRARKFAKIVTNDGLCFLDNDGNPKATITAESLLNYKKTMATLMRFYQAHNVSVDFSSFTRILSEVVNEEKKLGNNLTEVSLSEVKINDPNNKHMDFLFNLNTKYKYIIPHVNKKDFVIEGYTNPEFLFGLISEATKDHTHPSSLKFSLKMSVAGPGIGRRKCSFHLTYDKSAFIPVEKQLTQGYFTASSIITAAMRLLERNTTFDWLEIFPEEKQVAPQYGYVLPNGVVSLYSGQMPLDMKERGVIHANHAMRYIRQCGLANRQAAFSSSIGETCLITLPKVDRCVSGSISINKIADIPLFTASNIVEFQGFYFAFVPRLGKDNSSWYLLAKAGGEEIASHPNKATIDNFYFGERVNYVPTVNHLTKLMYEQFVRIPKSPAEINAAYKSSVVGFIKKHVLVSELYFGRDKFTQPLTPFDTFTSLKEIAKELINISIPSAKVKIQVAEFMDTPLGKLKIRRLTKHFWKGSLLEEYPTLKLEKLRDVLSYESNSELPTFSQSKITRPYINTTIAPDSWYHKMLSSAATKFDYVINYMLYVLNHSKLEGKDTIVYPNKLAADFATEYFKCRDHALNYKSFIKKVSSLYQHATTITGIYSENIPNSKKLERNLTKRFSWRASYKSHEYWLIPEHKKVFRVKEKQDLYPILETEYLAVTSDNLFQEETLDFFYGGGRGGFYSYEHLAFYNAYAICANINTTQTAERLVFSYGLFYSVRDQIMNCYFKELAKMKNGQVRFRSDLIFAHDSIRENNTLLFISILLIGETDLREAVATGVYRGVNSLRVADFLECLNLFSKTGVSGPHLLNIGKEFLDYWTSIVLREWVHETNASGQVIDNVVVLLRALEGVETYCRSQIALPLCFFAGLFSFMEGIPLSARECSEDDDDEEHIDILEENIWRPFDRFNTEASHASNFLNVYHHLLYLAKNLGSYENSRFYYHTNERGIDTFEQLDLVVRSNELHPDGMVSTKERTTIYMSFFEKSIEEALERGDSSSYGSITRELAELIKKEDLPEKTSIDFEKSTWTNRFWEILIWQLENVSRDKSFRNSAATYAIVQAGIVTLKRYILRALRVSIDDYALSTTMRELTEVFANEMFYKGTFCWYDTKVIDEIVTLFHRMMPYKAIHSSVNFNQVTVWSSDYSVLNGNHLKLAVDKYTTRKISYLNSVEYQDTMISLEQLSTDERTHVGLSNPIVREVLSIVNMETYDYDPQVWLEVKGFVCLANYLIETNNPSTWPILPGTSTTEAWQISILPLTGLSGTEAGIIYPYSNPGGPSLSIKIPRRLFIDGRLNLFDGKITVCNLIEQTFPGKSEAFLEQLESIGIFDYFNKDTEVLELLFKPMSEEHRLFWINLFEIISNKLNFESLWIKAIWLIGKAKRLVTETEYHRFLNVQAVYTSLAVPDAATTTKAYRDNFQTLERRSYHLCSDLLRFYAGFDRQYSLQETPVPISVALQNFYMMSAWPVKISFAGMASYRVSGVNTCFEELQRNNVCINEVGTMLLRVSEVAVRTPLEQEIANEIYTAIETAMDEATPRPTLLEETQAETPAPWGPAPPVPASPETLVENRATPARDIDSITLVLPDGRILNETGTTTFSNANQRVSVFLEELLETETNMVQQEINAIFNGNHEDDGDDEEDEYYLDEEDE
jgi:hypothetical protein